MRLSGVGLLASAAIAVALSAVSFTNDAHARDFFSNFFSSFGRERPAQAPAQALPFAAEFGNFGEAPPPPPPAAVPAASYCVRTCDGRYFPLTGASQSRASTCNSLCPASETKVFYGSSIDNASTDGGKPYSTLANAFKYRNEIVAGCTCNGKDAFGLARVKIEDDPTVRRGDLVANKDGLAVAASTAGSRRGASASYSAATRSARAQFNRIPVVAAE